MSWLWCEYRHWLDNYWLWFDDLYGFNSFNHHWFDVSWLHGHRFDNHWFNVRFSVHDRVNHWRFMIVSNDGITDNMLVVLIPTRMNMHIFTMVVNNRSLMIRYGFNVCWLNNHRFDVCWLNNHRFDVSWLDVCWLSMMDHRFDVGRFDMMNHRGSDDGITDNVLVVLIPTLMNIQNFAMVMYDRRVMISRLLMDNFNWLDIRWFMDNRMSVDIAR